MRKIAAIAAGTLVLAGCGSAAHESLPAKDRGTPSTAVDSKATVDRWIVAQPPAEERAKVDESQESVTGAKPTADDLAFAESLPSLSGLNIELGEVRADRITPASGEPYTQAVAALEGEYGGLSVSWRRLDRPAQILPDAATRKENGVSYKKTRTGEVLTYQQDRTGKTARGSSITVVSPTGFQVAISVNGLGSVEAIDGPEADLTIPAVEAFAQAAVKAHR